jgi:hypothetical protein
VPHPDARAYGARVALSGAVIAGRVPGATPGAAVQATLATGVLWPVEFGVMLFPDARIEAESEGVKRGEVAYGLSVVSGAACPLAPSRGLLLCAGAQVEFLDVRAELSNGEPATQVFVSPIAAVIARLKLTGLLFGRSAVTLAVPLSRSTYVFDTAERDEIEVFRAWPVLVQADLGLGMQF